MRLVACVAGGLFLGFSGMQASAVECRGNPHALGTSRIIAVDPAEHPRIGSLHYAETLPLADKEVVLTFDDGPLPAYTDRVLAALAAECVRATFFSVGAMARAHPEAVRRIYNAGHTVGTHTQNHPRFFPTVPHDRALAEIDEGIASVAAALGDERALAPFFRFPGLGRTPEAEAHLARRGIMTWGVDAHADDWMKLTTTEVIGRLLGRLEAKGRGVLLLHDIQPVTAIALPQILAELKARRYRVVHVVPAGANRPKTVTEPEAWALTARDKAVWPKPARAPMPAELPVPSSLSFGFPAVPTAADLQARNTRAATDAWPEPPALTDAHSTELAGPEIPRLDLALRAFEPVPAAAFPRIAERKPPKSERVAKRAPVRSVPHAPESAVPFEITGGVTQDQPPRPPGLIGLRPAETRPAMRREAQAGANPAWARRLNWAY